MTSDFSAGPLTRRLWREAGDTLREIEALPFLFQLVEGSLDPLIFGFYIMQDDAYLAGYARAMSLLAAKAPDHAGRRFWVDSVAGALTVEEQTHAAMLADKHLRAARKTLAGRVRPSPTTLGYVSYLQMTAALRAYPVGVAGVLPCFWVYAHVGKYLTEQAGELPEDHPYKMWIDLYDSPGFDESTRQAVQILEDCLRAADEATREEMQAVFLQACTYELHFWHASYLMQDWSLSALSASRLKK